ncbi:hypothetical protein SPONN_213 [uncultured Candidatus Thioglobus sp.]|nr:hypothetical protein SPONN_213 [uncultured Candidatus Thioglobus sp.]
MGFSTARTPEFSGCVYPKGTRAVGWNKNNTAWDEKLA